MIGPLLEEGLPALGLAPPAGAVERLDRYAELLLEKNQVMNLTAITEPEQVARLHMLDCAALLNVCPLEGNRLLDVGTGAGFPGMVLKILVPSLDVTLLDSLNKRLDWLAETCGALGLTGIRTVHARAEERSHDPAFRETFDAVTSRAVAELRTLCELCLPYVRPGGYFLAMKSVDSDREIEDAAAAVKILGGGLERVQDYEIPGTDIRHRVVVIKKLLETPKKYPRAFAKMKKNPL